MSRAYKAALAQQQANALAKTIADIDESNENWIVMSKDLMTRLNVYTTHCSEIENGEKK